MSKITCLILQIGAICLWSYVYNIVRVFSSNAREGINLHNSPINMNRESLLASGDCSISEEYSHQFTLPHPLSEENLQVVPTCLFCCKSDLLWSEEFYTSQICFYCWLYSWSSWYKEVISLIMIQYTHTLTDEGDTKKFARLTFLDLDWCLTVLIFSFYYFLQVSII